MLAVLTLSKKPHHNPTGFDHANHSKLIGNPARVTELPQNCNNTDTICGVSGGVSAADPAAEVGARTAGSLTSLLLVEANELEA